MAHKGKIHLTIMMTATPDLVEEGKRLVASHSAWMAETHYREGDKALLSYNFSVGPEKANPLDPTSEDTGNSIFLLSEIYETPAGIVDHWTQAQSSWGDFGRCVAWMQKCDPKTAHGGEILASLW